MDYSNIESILSGFDRVLSLSGAGAATTPPSPLIFIGVPMRTGLSPIKIASRIIGRKGEAGLSIGVLPSGAINPDEIMERIRVEEIINALQQEAVVSVAIPPGLTLNASGISPAGPVTVFGATITFSKGYGVIQ